MDTECTNLDNDTEPNLTVSESSAIIDIDKTDDKKSLPQKSIKKKRKYTPRKKKNKVIVKYEQTDKNTNGFDAIDNLTFQCNDNINNGSLGDNSTRQNKIWNPFQISLFLSMLQYRRSSLQMSFPVSLFHISSQRK